MTNCYSAPTPIFQPAMRIISAITKADPAVVTTTLDHDFINGEIIRLVIPKGFGMTQANQLFGEINIIDATSFEIGINTKSFDSFACPNPLPSSYTCAQCIPIGEDNSILSGATKNTLPSRQR